MLTQSLSIQDQGQFSYQLLEEDAELLPRQLSADLSSKLNIFDDDEKGKANFALSVATIVKASIGSGILVLPYTVSKCGIIFVILLFIIASFLTQFCCSLLLKSKNLSGHSSYSTILYRIFKTKRSIVLGSVFIFLGNLGVCIAEIIIFKKTMRKIFMDFMPGEAALDEFYTSQLFLGAVVALLQTPYLFVRKIQKLKIMAFVGVICIVVFIIAFLIHFGIASSQGKLSQDILLFPQDWSKTIAAIPNIIYALAFMYSFFPVFKGMKQSSDKRMKMTTMAAISIDSIFYLVIGITGYWLLGSSVKGNFLESLPYDSMSQTLYLMINCGFVFSIFFTFPIVFFGSRNHFVALLTAYGKQQRDNTRQESEKEVLSEDKAKSNAFSDQKKYDFAFIAKSLVVFGVIVAVGLSVEDITIVFNAVGAICSTSNCFFLPCIFYIMLVKKKRKTRRATYYIAITIFTVMVPFAIYTVVAKYAHN